MVKLGGKARSSIRRNNWLPHEASRRLQRDAMTGLVMVLLGCIALLVLASTSDAFTVKFIDGLPQMMDGTPCQLLRVTPYDDPAMPMRAMVDCGDAGGLGVSGLLQHLFLALSAVGVMLLLSAVFSWGLASRMPRETLVVPFCVVATIIGIIAVWWGLQGRGPALVFQGPRDVPVAGVLRVGGSVSTREGAVSWGVGLLASSFVRLTRP